MKEARKTKREYIKCCECGKTATRKCEYCGEPFCSSCSDKEYDECPNCEPPRIIFVGKRLKK